MSGCFRIYLATSRTSGKSYIGKTSRSIDARWQEHKRARKSMLPFHKAIRKYGADDFVVKEIALVDNKEEMDRLEKFWILELKTYIKDFGYNLSFGGDGGGHPTEDVIEKHRANSLKRGPSRKDVNTSDIVALYTSGMSLIEISDRLGCSKFLVRHRLLKAEVPRRPASKRIHPSNRKGELAARYKHSILTPYIISLYHEGLSLTEIGKRVSLSRAAVTERLKSKNIPIRRSGGMYGFNQHIAA